MRRASSQPLFVRRFKAPRLPREDQEARALLRPSRRAGVVPGLLEALSVKRSARSHCRQPAEGYYLDQGAKFLEWTIK
jgi:hypothetical protein